MTETTSKLLIVEDSAVNQVVLTEYLSDAGYRVEVANDGEEGWEALEHAVEPFDAILLDRMMPRLDGMGLLARIKADARFRLLPVIFQTAAANPADVAEGLRAGAFYYLTKPFTQDVLLAIMRSALDDVALVRGIQQKMALSSDDLSLVRSIDFECRTVIEARRLAEILARFYPDPKRSVIGSAELLINAVEHGNLGLTYKEKSTLLQNNGWESEIERRLNLPENAAKRVTARLELTAQFVTLTVRDQGQGFAWQNYLEMSPERAYDPNGRGIAMARMLGFDTLEYQGNGNEVIARTLLGHV